MFKWVQHSHAELAKITHVPGHDHEPMHDGNRRDHGIFNQGIRQSMLESRLFPERGRIHRQHSIRGKHLAKPSFQLVGAYGRDPIQNALMRIGTAQFRNNFGATKIHGFIQTTVTLDDDAFYAEVSALPCALPARAVIS